MTWKPGAAAHAVPFLASPRTPRLLMLSALAIGAIAAVHWRAVFDPIAMAAAIGRHPAAPLGFLAIHIVASLVFVPRSLLAIGAGVLFGTTWGILWAELGSVAGAAAGFLLARYISSGFVDAERGTRLRSALERVERGGWRAVVLVRLIPIMPHSLANYALGLTRIPLAAYAFGSLLGQLPLTIAYVEFGAAGERILWDGAGWIEPTLIGLAAFFLSLLPPAYFRWSSR
jgi:uncharacterized membrane protein YdjX (TVP38/TMEM64 family)